ncbi:MAG: methyltransferase domain-containing protein [Betaproteobacteria bacterium]|nr:methyltransferase domain-containing protein [Betaproteobacteria bacterium]
MAQDSSKPEFWETRYLQNFMPWDAGFVPQALKRFAVAHPPGRVLLPGCGSAYEARYLAEVGWDVTAIDFSPAAVEAAQRTLGRYADRVRLDDFFHFAFDVPFDVVYERAFLCALPRKMWRAYAERVAEVLGPRGLLAGYFYYHDEQRGPPFGTNEQELTELMEKSFERIANEFVTDSIDVFVGKERWQVWQRR